MLYDEITFIFDIDKGIWNSCIYPPGVMSARASSTRSHRQPRWISYSKATPSSTARTQGLQVRQSPCLRSILGSYFMSGMFVVSDEQIIKLNN